MRKVFLVSTLALFFACLALAQMPSGPPKPAPEMANLKYFAGTWTCSGDSPANPFGPAHKTQTSVTIKSDLDGHWYDGMVVEAKTTSNPHPMKGMVHMGYDTSAKKYVMVWLDNTGAWSSQMSSGWEGDTMTWTGEAMVMGENVSSKDTFIKKGANEVAHKSEMTMKGENHLMLDETCKKAGKM